MLNAVDQNSPAFSPSSAAQRIATAMRTAGPLLLFGLRLWAAVCLALYVAFWLELDNAYWAGTSAALVCQPRLGASLRKGWFRMIGTVVGAVAIVLLTAAFAQDRAAFLIGLALWGAGCTLVSTQLRNFASYAAALAGYTVAIIASDELGATGGANGDAFMLAITRVSEIWIGIVCAGIVLAGTDFGGASRRLAAMFASLSAEVGSRFASMLARSRSNPFETQAARRELARRVIALDPAIDEAIGESSRLRYNASSLLGAAEGLVAALAAWRVVTLRLGRLSDPAARQGAEALLRSLPPELQPAPGGKTPPWTANPLALRRQCGAAVRTFVSMPASSPSLRLLADQAARMLAGFCHALDGLALLAANPARRRSRRRNARLLVADWLPAFVDACRACLAIGAAEFLWIITEWPSGAGGITWTAITVLLFGIRANEGYGRALSFTMGNCLGAVCAAILLFAVLPNVGTFAGFSVALAIYLIPVGALMAQPWQAALFTPMAANLVPLMSPANQMSYDTLQFYNAALAIVVGCGIGALSFRLVPPLPTGLRTERLLTFTLCDVRRAATDPTPPLLYDWKARIYSRLAAIPDAAEPLQRAQLMAALSVGIEIIHLRRVASKLGIGAALEGSLGALAQGRSAQARTLLAELDQRLAPTAVPESHSSLAMRVRGRMLVISDALLEHAAFFDVGAPR